MIGGEHPIHVNLRLLIGLDLIPLDLILLSSLKWIDLRFLLSQVWQFNRILWRMMMMMISFTAYCGHFSVHRGTLALFWPLYNFSDALSSERLFFLQIPFVFIFRHSPISSFLLWRKCWVGTRTYKFYEILQFMPSLWSRRCSVVVLTVSCFGWAEIGRRNGIENQLELRSTYQIFEWDRNSNRNFYTEAKRCFATHDEDIILICVYILF